MDGWINGSWVNPSTKLSIQICTQQKKKKSQSFHNNNFQFELLNVVDVVISCPVHSSLQPASRQHQQQDTEISSVYHQPPSSHWKQIPLQNTLITRKTRNESFAVDLWIYPSSAANLWTQPNRCGPSRRRMSHQPASQWAAEGRKAPGLVEWMDGWMDGRVT